MDARKFRLFMAYHDMSRQDVAAAVGVVPCRISSAFGAGTCKGGTEVRTMKLVDDFTEGVSEELRAAIKGKMQAILPDGVDIGVILPTDDRVVVTVNGQLVGFYVPELDKLIAAKTTPA